MEIEIVYENKVEVYTLPIVALARVAALHAVDIDCMIVCE